MGIISYAQNFEDVLLWRALGHIQQGCYIDIGAHDPIVDSVSKAFYEHGWRGIHVEPLPVYCNALRRDRPDETVLQAAVAAETGVLRFFEIPDTGISTGDEAIAQSHRERGFRINEITVPCVTLAQVFELVQGEVVHWLKIDVEGLEEQVLQGWGESSLRPWVVVVESTLPLTQDEVFSTWESLLTDKGYRCVHFDGLNRYYLAEEHSALESAFHSGPNVFDGFQLNGTASNTFTQHVAQNIRDEMGGQIESFKQQALLHKTDEPRLAEELEHSEKLKQALQAEQAANLQNQNAAKALALQFEQQARRETEAQLRAAMYREQEFTAQLLAGKDQLQQLEQAHRDREKQLQEQLAQAAQQAKLETAAQLRAAMHREQEFTAQLLAGKDQLQQLEQAHRNREQQLQEQLAQAAQQAKLETEAQLRAAMYREQEFTAQLLAGQDQLQQLELAHRDREQQLQEQLAQAEQQAKQEIEAQLQNANQREQEFTAQLLAGKDQLQRLELAHRDREQQLQEQLAQTEQQAKQEIEAQLHNANQREQEFTAQLLAARAQLQQLEIEHRNRQGDLLARLAETERQSRLESEAHFRKALEREQAVAEQLQALQQQAAQALAQQASELQSQHDELEAAWRTQEKTLHQEIANLASEVHALRHANELQTQKHGFVMDAHLGEHQRLIEAYAALESRLKAEIEAEQQTNMRLRQALAEVQQILAETYGSLSWRLTSPLRKLWYSFVSAASKISPTSISNMDSQVKQPEEMREIFGGTERKISPTAPSRTMDTAVVDIEFHSTEQIMTPILHVQDLLNLSGERLVRASYAKLLGREPDATGLAHYTRRLQQGCGRKHVVADIANSEEARRAAIDLPGLKELVRSNELKRSWWRKFFAMPICYEQSLNRFEELLDVVRENAQQMEQRLDARLGRLEAAVFALQSGVGQAPGAGEQAQLAVEAVQRQSDQGQQGQLWLKRIQLIQGRK